MYYSDELYHHGIKGQKWGTRRYQYEDGSLTPEGRQRYGVNGNGRGRGMGGGSTAGAGGRRMARGTGSDSSSKGSKVKKILKTVGLVAAGAAIAAGGAMAYKYRGEIAKFATDTYGDVSKAVATKYGEVKSSIAGWLRDTKENLVNGHNRAIGEETRSESDSQHARGNTGGGAQFEFESDVNSNKWVSPNGNVRVGTTKYNVSTGKHTGGNGGAKFEFESDVRAASKAASDHKNYMTGLKNNWNQSKGEYYRSESDSQHARGNTGGGAQFENNMGWNRNASEWFRNKNKKK